MDFEEKISAFMDGALETADEIEFLHILSVSPEKRALLHTHLAIRSMIASDARAMSVPARVDKAVLSAAGLILAGGAAAAGSASAGGAAAAGLTASTGSSMGGATGAAAAGVTSAVAGGAGVMSGIAAGAAAGWWSAWRITLATLLGMALFTSGFFVSSWFDSDDVSEAAIVDKRQPASSSPAAPLQPESGAVFDSPPRGQHASVSTRIDTVFIREAVKTDHTAGTHETAVLYRIDTVYLALEQQSPTQRPVMITEFPVQTPVSASPGRFDVELRRDHVTTWPYIDYAQAGVNREQQHLSLAVAYAFDTRHAAGVMFGERAYAMEYYRIANDSLYLFQRQPSLLYGGGFYRFSLPLSAGITPELMLQAGGTDHGPFLGGRLTLRLTPIERLSVLVGADASLLAYRYKEKIFTSHTVGLTYGVRYHF
jgi:hypothetical protein